MKPRLRMVEEASERFEEKSIGRDSISQEDFLEYIGSNFEGLSSRKIDSLQEIILPIQEEILEMVEDKSYLGYYVNM